MKKNREKRKQLVKKTAVILVAANVLAMPLVTQVAPYTGKAFFYPTYPTEPTQPEPPIPTKPVVYPAKAGQTTVSGTISNASAYYLSVNGYMYSGMPISNAFTCYLTKPLQQGDVIKVYGTGSMSTQGETTTIIVGPGDSVPAPTISSVLSTQDYVTGTAKAGSTVTLTINGTQYTGVANTSGVYRIGIPTQAPGTVIYAKASLYGQTSPTVNTTVINGDTTPPNAPVLNSVMDTDRVVSGQAEANSTVRLYVGSTLVGTGTASNTGYFSITMNTAQPAGTTITATATDAAGNVSPKGSTVVKSSDTIPPNAPIIDPVKDNQTVITGTAEANSTVKLYNGSVLIGQTVASSSGWYAINMGTTYPAGTILRATATDAAGNTSTYGTQTVGSSVILTAPTIDPASSGDRVVSGTSTPNTAIILTVNGVKYQGATGPTGVYSVSVPALTAGTLIEAYAQSGTEVSPITRATVSDVAIKTPTINSITNQDTSVTGTADPNVTITISVPGGGTWTGYSDASGNYSVAISPQPAGTVIEATATKNGKVSDKARTTVIQTGIGTPTINTVTSNDTLVTGKTEPNASITLSIPQTDGSSKNWTGTADSNGNYTIIIPKQAGGTLIEVVAKKNGLTSEKASTTVVQTGIGTPTINTVTSNDTLVTGKAEPNASITLSIPQTDGSTKNWTGTADSNGDYAIVIPKQAGGTAIEVTASKNGMTSEKASTTVVQTALDTPTINTVTNKDTVVTGKAEPNAVIKVNIPQITGGTITWEGTSDASGNYSIIIPKQVAGTQIEVIAEKGGLASPKSYDDCDSNRTFSAND
ncbi:putative biofilm-associated protein [Listeria floridensis FSL S10-1187]|uniref:Biofilm-associated protein n=1 Tax=Listeria floridensis FSL S10-1187 TaxID=1265817 RepID=A0ABP3B0V8_9LIST|nr:Ig-like domain-containing protein [Listeria floridensis]EUJ32289.1 putative biofilm-associated protein [Listeria floridensis FSL S10-1187]